MKKYWPLLLIMSLLLLLIFLNLKTRNQNGDKNEIYDPQHYLSKTAIDKINDYNSEHDIQIKVFITPTFNEKTIKKQADKLVKTRKNNSSDILLAISTNDKQIALDMSRSKISSYDKERLDYAVSNAGYSLTVNNDFNEAVLYIVDKINLYIPKETKPKYGTLKLPDDFSSYNPLEKIISMLITSLLNMMLYLAHLLDSLFG